MTFGLKCYDVIITLALECERIFFFLEKQLAFIEKIIQRIPTIIFSR